ncbi:MAG: phage tail tape measure protein, partial [Blastocatellia bacterium]
ALLKREAGLEGSQAGTSLTSLFSMFVTHKDQLKKLGQQTGVKFELFDKKGQFLGWENMFKQAEQLQKLPAEKRMIVLNKAFGEQGAKAFNAFVEAGVAGWKNVTAEAAKAVPVNDKINAQMETYNAKMEAVMGSIENLTATAFTPMLGTLKPVLDLTNNIVGSLQRFAKENPAIAGVAGHLLGIGSAALIGYAGVKTLTTGLALFRIASAVGSNQTAILGMLGIGSTGAAQSTLNNSLSQVFGGARVVVGNEIDRSSRTWSDKMRGVGSRMGSMLLTGFGVGGAFYLFDLIMEGRSQTKAAEQQAREAGIRLGENIREGMKQEIEGKLSDVALAELRKVRAEQEARPRVESLGIPKTATGSISDQFSPASEFNATLASTLGQAFYSRNYGGSLAELWEGQRRQGGGEEWIRGKLHSLFLTNADQLTQFLDEAKKEYQKVEQPEMFVQLKRLAGETYPELMRQVESSDGSLQKMTQASDAAATSLFRLSTINPPLFPMFNPNTQNPAGKTIDRIFKPKKSEFHFEKLNPPPMASGGFIEREGLVHIHSGERVVPAARVRRDANRADGSSGFVNHGGIHLHITVPAGSAAANNPEAFAELAVKTVTRATRKQRERR